MEDVRKNAQKLILASSFALLLLYDKALPAEGVLFGSAAGRLLLVFVAGLISHETLHGFVFRVLNLSETFQKLVWRERYMDGFWVYTSYDEQRNMRRGVWRIKQDLCATTIVGFGVDGQLFKISRVTSLSPVIETEGLYEVVNRRVDWDHSADPILSISTFSLDAPVKRKAFCFPVTFRGETQIFGGPRSGKTLTNAVWRKYENCRTEEDVLSALRTQSATPM